MLTLAGRAIEIKEMTWLQYKNLMRLIGTDLVGKREQLKELVKSGKGAAEWLEEMPELVTRALATALGIEPDDINKATGSEILDLIPEVIRVNKLAENIEKAKNLRGLLGVPTQQPAAEAGKAETEIRVKLKGSKRRG